MKIERFEDLIAWQQARKLAAMVYNLTNGPKFQGDRDLTRQMRRAAVSVMANIAEGFSRYSFKDSKVFFTTSRSSLDELRSHGYIALDQGYLDQSAVTTLQEQMQRVGQLLTGLIRNSRQQLAKSRGERVSESASARVSALNQ